MSTALNFDEGVDKLLATCEGLIAAKRDPGRPVVAGIVGGSASGKTHLAKRLCGATGASTLSLDNYYHGRAYMREHGIARVDDPRALDIPLLGEHINALIGGEAIEQPIYSFREGERESRTMRVEPGPLIVVEGLYLFLDEAIRNACDARVFVRAGEHAMFWRRILRDMRRTGQSATAIAEMFAGEVYPAHKEYVEPQEQYAHIVVENPLVPAHEMIDLREGQMQCKVRLGALTGLEHRRLMESILALGFDWHDTFMQVDAFFTHQSQGGACEEELVRLRTEHSQTKNTTSTTLAYKGPYVEMSRGIYQFPVAPAFASALLRLGYRADYELTKQRFLFVRPDCPAEIALDTVLLEPGRAEYVLEFRADCEENFLPLAELFRAEDIEMTGKSYWELYGNRA